MRAVVDAALPLDPPSDLALLLPCRLRESGTSAA